MPESKITRWHELNGKAIHRKKKKKEEKVAWNMSTVVIFTKDKSEK